MEPRVVFERNADLGSSLFGGQMARDFFLRWNENLQVAFHHCLTRERVAGLQICCTQAQGRTAPHTTSFDDDRTASATPLSPARNVEVNAGGSRGVHNQRAMFYLDGFFRWLEMNALRCDDRTPTAST
jgi:hypothetical protein